MKKFYHQHPEKVETHVEVFTKRDSEHTFIIGSMPRTCKCILSNKDHAIFEIKVVGVSRFKTQPDVIAIPMNQDTLESGVIMDQSGSREIAISGLYKDSTGFSYTKELRKVDEYKEVQVGDEFESTKHRDNTADGFRQARKIKVVHITSDGSLIVEYPSGREIRSEMMRTNDSAHATYPIMVLNK